MRWYSGGKLNFCFDELKYPSSKQKSSLPLKTWFFCGKREISSLAQKDYTTKFRAAMFFSLLWRHARWTTKPKRGDSFSSKRKMMKILWNVLSNVHVLNRNCSRQKMFLEERTCKVNNANFYFIFCSSRRSRKDLYSLFLGKRYPLGKFI